MLIRHTGVAGCFSLRDMAYKADMAALGWPVTSSGLHGLLVPLWSCTQGLWWAVVTVTTVGYGDRYRVTAFGQGVAVVLMLVGIGLIAVLTGAVASYFVGQDLGKATAEREQMRAELEAARIERQNLAVKLDVMQSQLAELLSRT
jgi:voltage-gated potassium channel